MKKLILLLIVVILCSCIGTKPIAYKSTYPTTPIIFNSNKNFEQVWDKLVDVFAQKGFSIRLIDKSSGLIVSQKSLLSTTFEGKDGKPINPNAYIVVPAVNWNGRLVPITGSNAGAYATEKQIQAIPVSGDWNVRVKSNGAGSTINVNINNLFYDSYFAATKLYLPVSISNAKTMGVFEKELSDIIK